MKKKMSERVLAMLLVLVMVITLIPVKMRSNALAAEEGETEAARPVISNITGNSESWINTDVILTVETDENSHVTAYSVDGINWQESNKFTISENGSYSFFVKDEEEHISDGTTVEVSKIDKTVPYITVVKVMQGDQEITDLSNYLKLDDPDVLYTFEVTAEDVGSGVALYSRDGGRNWQESGIFNITGAEVCQFCAKDEAGNVSDICSSIELNVDNEAPDITVTSNIEELTNKGVTFTVTASDNEGGAGLAEKAYKMDSGEWQAEKEFTVEDSKQHTIYVRDNASPANIAKQEIQAKNYCSAKPEITGTELSNSEWTKEEVQVTVSAIPQSNGFNTPEIIGYKMDDGNWQESPIFTVSDAKEHEFQVKDKAENVSEITKRAVTNFDNQAPQLQNSEEEGYKAIRFEQKGVTLAEKVLNVLTFEKFFNKTLKITVDAEDATTEESNVSGIVSATVTFGAAEKNKEYTFEANEIGQSDSTKITFTIENSDLPENFQGSVKITLKDKAENIADIQATDINSNLLETNFMIENTAPKVEKIFPSGNDEKGTYKGNYSVTFEISDKTEEKYSGLAQVVVYVNGEVVLTKDYSEKKETDSIQVDVKVQNKQVADKILTNKQWNKGALTFSIDIVDNAGNVYKLEDDPTYYCDNTAPEITEFKFEGTGYHKDESVNTEQLYELINMTSDGTYGFYFKDSVTVTIFAKDLLGMNEAKMAGIEFITAYLKDKDDNIYLVKENNSEIVEGSLDDREKISVVLDEEGKGSISFTVPSDFKGQIYAYATDKVGNEPPTGDTDGIAIPKCTSPDGTIVESAVTHRDTDHISILAPKTSYTQNTLAKEYKYGKEEQLDKDMNYKKEIVDEDKKVPLYKGAQEFNVTVSDTYSGIREVSYKLLVKDREDDVIKVQINNKGEVSEPQRELSSNDNTVDDNKGVLTVDDAIVTILEKNTNLVTEMTNTITVDGNYNDMVLLVELTDRAGNKSYDYYVFGIDKTAPVITVKYDNNNGDSQSGTGTYFKANRTATITVFERNFNKEDVKFDIKNAEGNVPDVRFVNDIEGTGNGDDTQHIFEVTYNNDGVYSFGVSCKDRAQNETPKEKVDYKASVAPTQFVIDKTLPTINVSYDNNNAQNEKYFKAHRTATITIVEHNFDVNRVNITQSSALAGNAIANPTVAWVSNGDTHTGTIHYNADGDYTFDITMTDKAGNKETGVNYGNSVATKEFTVDTTYADIVKVEGIANKGILGLKNGNIDDKATISIIINDINLDNYNVKLTRSRVLVTGESDEATDAKKDNVISNPTKQCENNVDVTGFVTNASGSDNATAVISIPKKDKNGVKNDGLYTLTIEAKDKAGNAYDTNANVITFSVNRFGSVFTYSKDLYELITKNDGYTKKVENELVIYEYNATPVIRGSHKVEVIANNDSKTLEPDKEYKVTQDLQQNETSWNKYEYTVEPNNFEKDGVYTLRISSTDEANITSQTVDYDICSATFYVDTKEPEITSVNYSPTISKHLGDEGGTAKSDQLEIRFTVEDLMRLDKVRVLVDKKETVYEYNKDFKDANTFEKVIKLESAGDAQLIQIEATDKAGNTIRTSDKKNYQPGYVFYDAITVSANPFVQFYADKFLFWGTIGGVVVVAGGIWFIIAAKRKKKEAE